MGVTHHRNVRCNLVTLGKWNVPFYLRSCSKGCCVFIFISGHYPKKLSQLSIDVRQGLCYYFVSLNASNEICCSDIASSSLGSAISMSCVYVDFVLLLTFLFRVKKRSCLIFKSFVWMHLSYVFVWKFLQLCLFLECIYGGFEHISDVQSYKIFISSVIWFCLSS
jgi:hypothetical protein